MPRSRGCLRCMRCRGGSMSSSARPHKPRPTHTVFRGTRHLKLPSQALMLRSRFRMQNQPVETNEFWLHGRQHFLKEMLCAFHAIPRAGLIFQSEDAGEIVIEHDSYVPLDVRFAEAIPELGMNGGMGVGS